jgi:hypothetical protein
MKTLLAFVIIWTALGAYGANWNPDARLLDAVCQIESCGGKYIYGDGGLSLGYYQIQKAAWSDVSDWRKKKNVAVYDYERNVLKPEISRSYAADYLTMIYERLLKQYQREPSPAEIYAAYNMGLNSFRKCSYDLARVNPVTAGKCQRLAALLK